MPTSKRRKTGKSSGSVSGSRSSSRAASPVHDSRSQSPVPTIPATNHSKAETEKESTPPLILPSVKRRGEYECDYCHTDISQAPRIRCAECPDFDLCLECFLTTDHSAAIARLRASVEARTLVENINAGGPHVQHQGKQAPIGSSAGGSQDSGAASSVVMESGLGALNHDDTHGYRVCDNIRYPMFPSANPSTAPPSRKAGSTSRTNSVATDGGSRPSSVVNFGGGSRANSVVNDGGGSARSSVSGDAMDVDAAAAEGDEDKTSEASGNQKEDARLVLQDYIYVPDPEPKNIWTVEEDLRLLEGIQQHGLGNWVDIAEFVSGNGSLGKAPRKCMERYFDDFLGRYGHILPPYTIVEEDDNKEDDEDDTDKEESNKTASTPGKSMDPTRVSQRSLSAQKRKTSLLTQQSLSSRLSNKKLKLVPTESLPEYKKILEMFPNPRIPVKDPPVQAGQKVGRFEAARAEREYINEIAKVKDSPEEVKKIREHWERTRLNQPGGPTVLPVLDNHVAEMPGSNLAGFMPRRGDFDIEYENNAEEALADMEFLPGDREDEKELKLKVLRIYNEKLDEREKRKKFILERELYDYRKNLAENEKNMPQDERDLIRRMRLFERFHTKEEHEQFIQDILKAKRLRKEIAKLQTYRRMGMTSMVEAEKYELDKITRENHKHAAKNAAEAKEAATAQTGASGDNPAVNSKVEESVWKQYQKPRRSSSRGTKDSATSAPPDGTSTLEKSKDDGAVQNKEDDVPKPMEVDSDKQQQGKTDRDSSADADFVLEKMEGVELLSDKEKELLRRIQLTPKQFLDVKKVLIHESLRSGMLDKEKEGSSRTLVHIDVKKRGDVIDFMVQAGWVKSKIGRTISE